MESEDMKNINKRYILTLAITVLAAALIINALFLFNPLTFRKDAVTSYDWQDYRKPIEVVYYYLDSKEGWKETAVARDGKEARFIVSELKKTKQYKYYQEDYLIPYETRGRECKVIIRRVLGNSEYLNLLQFDFFEKGEFSNLGSSDYLKLTKELKAFLLTRL
jgi:hypothetical protein